MHEFWNEAGFITRTALVCAAISLAINIATYFGLVARGPFAAIYIIHLITMTLCFATLARTGYHHFLAFGRNHASTVGTAPSFRLVKPLVWPVILALAYFLFMFAVLGSYGEGYPAQIAGQYYWVRKGVMVRVMQPSEVVHLEALELRAFSSGWLFFLLTIAAWDEYFRRKIMALKASPLSEEYAPGAAPTAHPRDEPGS